MLGADGEGGETWKRERGRTLFFSNFELASNVACAKELSNFVSLFFLFFVFRPVALWRWGLSLLPLVVVSLTT